MIVYTVHEPPAPPSDRLERAAALEFICDGFSPVAAVLAPLWLAAHRVWLALAGYLAALLVLGAVTYVAGVDLRWALLLLGAIHLGVGFEAASLRRWAMEGRGWMLLGTVAGRTTEDCERRFFDDWLPGKPFLSGAGLGGGAGGLAGAVDGVGRRAGSMQSLLVGWRGSARKA